LIDALRWDYISESGTAFLNNLASNNKYIKRVVPGVGFCERTEILTGKSPGDYGFFTALGYDPAKSPYKGNKWLKIFDQFVRLSNKRLYKKVIRKLLWWINKDINHIYKPYFIPIMHLEYFTLTEDYFEMDDPRQFKTGSLLTDLVDTGGSYFTESFTSLSDNASLTALSKEEIFLNALDDQHDLYFLYIGEIDMIGHEYGPKSNEMRLALCELDTRIEKIKNEVDKKYSDSTILILGDHGMANVTNQVDVSKIIKFYADKLNLEEYVNYLSFLDSTVLRIWIFSKEARLLLASLKNDKQLLRFGQFLDSEQCATLGIPLEDNINGDLIWLANSGAVIYPDYFHDHLVKGMHGYVPLDESSHGTCIVIEKDSDNTTVDQIDLKEIYSIVRSSLKKNRSK
jgi:predicted AlkP superfamily pyrophosphatase or phosphodiesterase